MSKKTKNGSKRWVKSSSDNCDLVLFYKKKFGGTFIHGKGNQYIVKVGKVSNDKFYEWKAYNKFSKDGENIPKGYQKIDIPKKVIQTFLVGSNDKNMKELMKLSKKKHYFTIDNGGKPFCVYILGKNVIVYKETKLSHWKTRSGNKDYVFMMEWFHYLNLPSNISYNEKIKSFNPKKIYIGKSPLNKMTKFSGGHGKKWDGNTILLHIPGNKYIYIGETITQFSLQKGDSVEKYWSPVGNSAVPYAFILGKKYVYFMWEFKYILREKLFENVDMNKVEKSDLSSVYYGFDKEKEAKNMKIKEIEKRMW